MGDKPMKIWLDGLKTLSDTQIELGMEMALRSGMQFPPSLATFLSWCRSAPYHEPIRASLEVKKALPSSVERHRRAIREKLGLPTDPSYKTRQKTPDDYSGPRRRAVDQAENELNQDFGSGGKGRETTLDRVRAMLDELEQ